MSEPLLRAEQVTKEYRQGRIVLKVLKGITLEVNEGEILAIEGPSGAGKSTLLHILGFLDRPTTGEVIFRGTRVSALKARERARIRNRCFGFVFQMYHLLPELTVMENTLIPLMIRHEAPAWLRERPAARRRAAALLNRLGLGDRVSHRPSELSGGEQQRNAIARALVGDPEVVFCDEPTGNLDRATGEGIRQLIAELNRETGKTFVLVTHDPETSRIAHRILKLVDGRLT